MAISDAYNLGAKQIFFYTEAGNSSENAYKKSGFEVKFKIAMLEPNYEKIREATSENSNCAKEGELWE